MGEPFIGEIRMFGFGFAPRKWALCDGQLVPCSQNPALYALLGTTFGGDGTNNFALPDMRGRAPIHAGVCTGFYYYRGMTGGAESVPLATSQLPAHRHTAAGTTATGNKFSGSPTRSLATSSDGTDPIYAAAADLQAMHADVVSPAEGGGQPHVNMQPTTVLNFCISLEGFFPPRN